MSDDKEFGGFGCPCCGARIGLSKTFYGRTVATVTFVVDNDISFQGPVQSGGLPEGLHAAVHAPVPGKAEGSQGLKRGRGRPKSGAPKPWVEAGLSRSAFFRLQKSKV